MQAMDGPIDIINVYNPRGNGPRISTWTTIEKVIDAAPGKLSYWGTLTPITQNGEGSKPRAKRNLSTSSLRRGGGISIS